MLEYISNHDFKLHEIIELKDVEITDFTLYVFKEIIIYLYGVIIIQVKVKENVNNKFI